MDIPENQDPHEPNSDPPKRRRRTRKRTKIKVKKRVRVKKKRSKKKQVKKLLERALWITIILGFLITLIYMVLELQDQEGPRKNKGKSRMNQGIEWRSW